MFTDVCLSAPLAARQIGEERGGLRESTVGLNLPALGFMEALVDHRR
jgi:hypothetical protein